MRLQLILNLTEASFDPPNEIEPLGGGWAGCSPRESDSGPLASAGAGAARRSPKPQETTTARPTRAPSRIYRDSETVERSTVSQQLPHHALSIYHRSTRALQAVVGTEVAVKNGARSRSPARHAGDWRLLDRSPAGGEVGGVRVELGGCAWRDCFRALLSNGQCS